MARMSRVVPSAAIAGVMLLAIVALGVALRYEDPLDTRALGAEDPYTHVVFVREWTEQGYFADSYNLGTTMYPPGMHAVIAILAATSGIDAMVLARLAPPLVGGLAILGMYALATRLGGRAAGLATALMTAVLPEHIFRTNLLFPTAFDLALLPVMLLAFHILAQPAGRGEGLIPAGRAPAFALFLFSATTITLMHPWVTVLFAGPMALYAAIRALRARGAPGDVARRIAMPVALLTLSVAVAMAFRWDESDTGFSDFLAKVPGLGWLASVQLPFIALFVLLLGILGALALGGVAAVATMARFVPRGRGASLAAGALAAIVLLAAIWPLTRNLPFEVSYVDMLGYVAIVLALAGVAIACLRPTPLGDMGLAISVPLFPLTAINFFSSPFWPQRTVAYLAVGALLLCGVTAGALYEALVRRIRAPSTARRVAVPAVMAACVLLVAGAVVAKPAPTYDWYRLYDDAQYAGFERVVDVLEDDPGSKVFVQTWQPALLVKALGTPEMVWYSPEFFKDGAKRSAQANDVNGAAYVLVDGYTAKECKAGKCNLDFLKDGSRYKLVYETPDGKLRLYRVET